MSEGLLIHGLPVDLADPVNKHHPLNQGRLAWWLALPGLDGGIQFHDLLGLYPGTLTSMGNSSNGWRGTTRPGGFGHLLFDGSAGYVACGGGNGSTLDITTKKITWGAWCYPKFTTGYHALSCRNNNVGGRQYSLYMGPDTSSLFLGGFSTVSAVTASSPWVTNAWNRIIVTYDGVRIKCFFNGLKVADLADTATITTVSGAGNFLGFTPGEPYGFSGAIDDAVLWSRPLSEAEVFADFDLGSKGYPGVLNRIAPHLFSASSSSLPGNASGTAALITLSLSAGAGTGAASGLGSVPVTSLSAPAGVGIGAGAASGLAPVVLLSDAAGVSTGAATASGTAPTITFAVAVGAGTGDALASGTASTVTFSATSGAGTGDALASGLTPTVTFSALAGAGVGVGSASGSAPVVTLSILVGAGGGAAVAAGLAPLITFTASTGAGLGDAAASGAAATVTLASPSGSASGGGVGNASGAAPVVSLSGPTGTGTGDATATGVTPTATFSAPSGTGAGAASTSGTAPVVTFTDPAGAASGGAAGNASGAAPVVALSSPTGAGTGSGGASGAAPGVALIAPSGTGAGMAAASGAAPAVTLSAPPGAAHDPAAGDASGAAPVITLSAPAAGGAGAAAATGFPPLVALSAPAGAALVATPVRRAGPQFSRTSLYYRERVGLVRTRRAPVPRLAPGRNLIHTVPVAPERIPPDLTRLVEGDSPDCGRTPVWPHGTGGVPVP